MIFPKQTQSSQKMISIQERTKQIQNNHQTQEKSTTQHQKSTFLLNNKPSQQHEAKQVFTQEGYLNKWKNYRENIRHDLKFQCNCNQSITYLEASPSREEKEKWIQSSTQQKISLLENPIPDGNTASNQRMQMFHQYKCSSPVNQLNSSPLRMKKNYSQLQIHKNNNVATKQSICQQHGDSQICFGSPMTQKLQYSQSQGKGLFLSNGLGVSTIYNEQNDDVFRASQMSPIMQMQSPKAPLEKDFLQKNKNLPNEQKHFKKQELIDSLDSNFGKKKEAKIDDLRVNSVAKNKEEVQYQQEARVNSKMAFNLSQLSPKQPINSSRNDHVQNSTSLPMQQHSKQMNNRSLFNTQSSSTKQEYSLKSKVTEIDKLSEEKQPPREELLEEVGRLEHKKQELTNKFKKLKIELLSSHSKAKKSEDYNLNDSVNHKLAHSYAKNHFFNNSDKKKSPKVAFSIGKFQRFYNKQNISEMRQVFEVIEEQDIQTMPLSMKHELLKLSDTIHSKLNLK